MLSIKIIFTFLYFSAKYFQLVDSMFCDDAELQVCDGTSVTVKASPKPKGQFPIEIKPRLTFNNIANVDEEEKTITVFLSLALLWNDKRVNMSNDTEHSGPEGYAIKFLFLVFNGIIG